MGGQNEHFGYLDVGRSHSCICDHVGYVFAGERLYAFVHVVGALLVSVEAYAAEVSLHKSGFYVGDARTAVWARSILSPSVIVLTAALVAQ